MAVFGGTLGSATRGATESKRYLWPPYLWASTGRRCAAGQGPRIRLGRLQAEVSGAAPTFTSTSWISEPQDGFAHLSLSWPHLGLELGNCSTVAI